MSRATRRNEMKYSVTVESGLFQTFEIEASGLEEAKQTAIDLFDEKDWPIRL